MSLNLKLSVGLFFLALASSLITMGLVVSATEDEATTAIIEAETNLGLAYQAIRDAEEAGANLSSLFVQLNEAAELLAQANISYRTGDLDDATNLASASTVIANNLKIEAYRARDNALYQRIQSFQLALAESILGITMVIAGGFVSWRLFKRRYYRRVLRLKPEISSDES